MNADTQLNPTRGREEDFLEEVAFELSSKGIRGEGSWGWEEAGRGDGTTHGGHLGVKCPDTFHPVGQTLHGGGEMGHTRHEVRGDGKALQEGAAMSLILKDKGRA